MDETKFCIKYKIAYWVIIMDVEKKLLLLDLDNRRFFTVYESISNRKIEILPILIFSGTHILEK